MDAPANVPGARLAVALYLPHPSGDGRLLGVSRGWRRPWDWNLPGGKVEPDEKPEDAIVRETFEETGILVAHPRAFFRRPVAAGPDGKSFGCIVYEASWVSGTPKLVGWEGWVRWIHVNSLLEGTFWVFNAMLLSAIQLSGGVDRMSVDTRGDTRSK